MLEPALFGAGILGGEPNLQQPTAQVDVGGDVVPRHHEHGVGGQRSHLRHPEDAAGVDGGRERLRQGWTRHLEGVRQIVETDSFGVFGGAVAPMIEGAPEAARQPPIKTIEL